MEPTTKPKVGPKDFFLWLGAMATLYASIISILTLYFQYIDRLFPDPLVTWVDPYSGAIRFAIATLVVVTPLYIYLTRTLNADVRANPEKKDLWVRRWIIFLTLFVGGLTIAIDGVMLINEFLGGELTTRFLVKSFGVFVVVAGFFWYYLSDLKGKWDTNVQLAHGLGYGVGVLVLVSIIAGFFIIGSPMDARLYKFDEQKVSDLQNIQWQVVSYYQQKGRVPTSLQDLLDPISGWTIPVDPQTGEQYTYKSDKLAFQLCATFNKDARPTSQYQMVSRPMSEPEPGVDGDLAMSPWNHGPGTMCFDREIDPERYPIFSKGSK